MSDTETRTIERQISALKDEVSALKTERTAAVRDAVKLAVFEWLTYVGIYRGSREAIVDEPNIRATIADLLPPARRASRMDTARPTARDR